MNAPARSPFREQAIAAHRRGAAWGSPLHAVPGWIRWSGRAVSLVVVSSVLFASCVHIRDFVRGPAVIRIEGRSVVTARASGSVAEVRVRPGERFERGAVLLRLDDAPQRAELERATREYELLLTRLLREPDDEALRKQLASLDAAAALARSRVDERIVVATEDGVVSDIRVRTGQRVEPGDALVAVDRPGSRAVIVAMLPGSERPRIPASGGEVLLELEGFGRERVPATLRAIGDEVVGPAEALRYLGQDQVGSIELRGPVVMIEAEIDAALFVAEGRSYRFFDGMPGHLEIEVGAQTVLASVLPEALGGRR